MPREIVGSFGGQKLIYNKIITSQDLGGGGGQADPLPRSASVFQIYWVESLVRLTFQFLAPLSPPRRTCQTCALKSGF